MSPYVKCPVCGSTAKSCKRPSGHDAMTWHLAREDAQARLCGCDICQEWLRHRGLAEDERDQLEMPEVNR